MGDYQQHMVRSNLPVNFDEQAVAEFCKLRGILRLSLFGSAVRDDCRRQPEGRDEWERTSQILKF